MYLFQYVPASDVARIAETFAAAGIRIVVRLFAEGSSGEERDHGDAGTAVGRISFFSVHKSHDANITFFSKK